MAETKECELCHRIGWRGFVPRGSEGWACFRDDLCRIRAKSRQASTRRQPRAP